MATLPHRSVAVFGGLVLVAVCGACSGGGDEAAISGSSSDASSSTTSTVMSTTVAPTTVAAPPTTLPPPICTVTVEPGDSLTAVATRSALTLEDLEAENAINSTVTIHPGQVFDICVGNDIDDITGTSRLAPPVDAVIRQQNELNELFSQYSLLPLEPDGDSGKYTRQAVCAARMGLGLPVNTGHLPAGSEEEATIFAATELGVPDGAPIENNKWILIDKTCQVIFTGERDELVDIFPTSTGVEGYDTHDVRAFAFRFDPALDNNGWHDSSSFPVAVDNPENGNMYKPLYFNNGQAIHGAAYIPPEPRSKGCARTFPLHQDMILAWLGLDDLAEPTWNVDEIGVSVVVQGLYQDRTS